MKWPLLPALLLAVAFSAIGCGGGAGVSSRADARSSARSCAKLAALSGRVNDRGTAAAAGTTLDIQAGDFFFAPTCETAVPAGTVTLVVKNVGGALHNVSIPSQGIDKDIPPGETIRVTVDAGSGSIQYFCKYHRTSGMVGALLP